MLSEENLGRASHYLDEAEEMLRERPLLEASLGCEACSIHSDRSARDWRAFLGLEDDDSRCVVVLCPDCAQEVDDG